MTQSVHISEHVNRNVAEVYLFMSRLEDLGAWMAYLPAGAEVRFTKPNYSGVLDHWYTSGGTTTYVPMRVIEDGKESEIVLTVRGDVDPAVFVSSLATLKQLLEA
jgi:hypothetical protein